MDNIYPNGLTKDDQDTLRDFHPEMYYELIEFQQSLYSESRCVHCGSPLGDCDCED